MGQKEKLIVEITQFRTLDTVFIFRLGFKTGANRAMPHITDIIVKKLGKRGIKNCNFKKLAVIPSARPIKNI